MQGLDVCFRFLFIQDKLADLKMNIYTKASKQTLSCQRKISFNTLPTEPEGGLTPR